jgi:hypothetical protein
VKRQYRKLGGVWVRSSESANDLSGRGCRS